MTQDYDHGVGTGKNDEIYKFRGQAQTGFRAWVGRLFGGRVPPPQRSADERTVLYEDKAKGITVTARSDRDGKDKLKVKGSIDVKSKVRTPSGVVKSETKHFGYEED